MTFTRLHMTQIINNVFKYNRCGQTIQIDTINSMALGHVAVLLLFICKYRLIVRTIYFAVFLFQSYSDFLNFNLNIPKSINNFCGN